MHHWQDYVLSLGAIIFIVALMPSVLGKNKPALSTSVMTGTVLIIYAFSYITLKLWFAAITTAGTGTQWFILAGQKYLQDKNKTK